MHVYQASFGIAGSGAIAGAPVLYDDDLAAAPLPARPGHPATAYAARPKAIPGDRTADTHDRVRTDRIDNTGLVTLRHNGRLHFLRIPETVPGAYRFDYAPNGVATGLSVADPGYDAAGTGLKDGLVLRGGTAPSPWGGSAWTWTDHAHLPG